MSENNLYEYIKYVKDQEKSGIEHKQFIKNSILEKLFSKMIFQYKTTKFELFDMINLLDIQKDAIESSDEAVFLKDILSKNTFESKNGLSFFNK